MTMSFGDKILKLASELDPNSTDNYSPLLNSPDQKKNVIVSELRASEDHLARLTYAQ